MPHCYQPSGNFPRNRWSWGPGGWCPSFHIRCWSLWAASESVDFRSNVRARARTHSFNMKLVHRLSCRKSKTTEPAHPHPSRMWKLETILVPVDRMDSQVSDIETVLSSLSSKSGTGNVQERSLCRKWSSTLFVVAQDLDFQCMEAESYISTTYKNFPWRHFKSFCYSEAAHLHFVHPCV